MQNMLPKFNDIEKSIGGRKKIKEAKVRLSFYLSKEESDKLKSIAEFRDTPVSVLVRELVRRMIEDEL
jgi:predicted DNA-binding protein